jgi:hypothetical protein
VCGGIRKVFRRLRHEAYVIASQLSIHTKTIVVLKTLTAIPQPFHRNLSNIPVLAPVLPPVPQSVPLPDSCQEEKMDTELKVPYNRSFK